jgi:L-histidine Nalpha-methyltransferase
VRGELASVSTAASRALSGFARDVFEGLSTIGQKSLPAKYFYDDLGSALFEAITFLPEYGLTRADERLLNRHAADIAAATDFVQTVCELGSGNGKKTRRILQGLVQQGEVIYHPIDVSAAALEVCQRGMGDLVNVLPICADWVEGLNRVSSSRSDEPLLVLFLGSSIGNLERNAIPDFLRRIRGTLKPGDFFLLGADLVKDVDTMLTAYDDATGVTAAFNLNILGRMNRELDANFDLRAFAHEARWNDEFRRIEMHLLSGRDQSVFIGALESTFHFQAGETIWTESSHKFSEAELVYLAASNGFEPIHIWVDRQWPFAEALWRVKD